MDERKLHTDNQIGPQAGHQAGKKAHAGAARGRNRVGVVTASVVAVSCVAFGSAFAMQSGTGAFDPSAFLSDSLMQQADPSFGSAYNTNEKSQDGEANMQQGDDEQQKSLDQVNTTDLSADGALTSAYQVGDGTSGLTIAGGGSGTGDGGNTVNGPVVEDPGNNNNTDGSESTPGSNGGVDDPTIEDPDPTTPKLPDPYFGDDGNVFDPNKGVGTDSSEGEPSVTVDFYTDNDFGNSITPLYNNEVLTKQKLMCAAYYYATINGTEYRLSELGVNFQVVSYAYDEGVTQPKLPETISPDASTLTVNFIIRANENSQWHEASMTFDLYPYKILLEDYEGDIVSVDSEWTYQYPNYYRDDQPINLTNQQSKLQPLVDEDGYLHNIFLGWSTSGDEGSQIAGDFYPDHKGLTILKPVPLVEVSDTMKVGYTTEFDFETSEEVQVITLFDAPSSGDVAIPEGVVKINSDSDAGVVWNPTSIGTLTIPSSMYDLGSNFDTIKTVVTDKFVVGAGNLYYSSANGLFIENAYDDFGDPYRQATVPSKMGDVLIPADVSELVFPDENVITSFATEGDNPQLTCENGLLIQWQEDMFGDWHSMAVVGGGMTSAKLPTSAEGLSIPTNNQLDWINADEGRDDGLVSINGMLCSQTVAEGPWESDSLAIITIPSKMETVTLPSGVTDITIPENSAIQCYENGDGDDFVRGTYWAFGGALCKTAMEEDEWGDRYEVSSIVDVPSSLTVLTIPAEVSSIAEDAIHPDAQLVAYEVEDGNGTFSSKNGLLLESKWVYDEMWDEWSEVVTATVPPKMKEVLIPAGVDSLVIPDNNCIWSFTAEEGSSIMVENGMIIEERWEPDEWGDWSPVKYITRVPSGMTRVEIPADVAGIDEDAIPQTNAIEWFEALKDDDDNSLMITSNGMIVTIELVEEDPFFPWEDPMIVEVPTITRVPDHMATVTIAEDISAIADSLFAGNNAVMEFVVEGEYSNFSVRNDLLYEFVDYDHYDIIGIPIDKAEIVVPGYVEDDWGNVYGIDSLVIPKSNSIKKLQYEGVHTVEWGMESDQLITPDFSNLHAGAQVMVPDANFMECYSAWNITLSSLGVSLVSDEGQSSDNFIIRDGARLSADGKTLIEVLDDNAGIYVVPDGVEDIASGATDGCTEVTGLVLPASVNSIESNALSAGNIQRILFQGDTPAAIRTDSFASETSLQVHSFARADYDNAWSECSPQLQSNNFLLSTPNGFHVLTDDLRDDGGAPLSGADNRSVLLKAPSSVVSFTSETLPDATITDINERAFEGIAGLKCVDLPASVKTIGAEAFDGCTGLELFCSRSTDTVRVKKNTFGDPSASVYALRYVAFSAQSADIDDSAAAAFQNVRIGTSANDVMTGKVFCPVGAKGYSDFSEESLNRVFVEQSSSYELDVQPSITLLYGRDSSGVTLLGSGKGSGTVTLDSSLIAVQDKALYNSGITVVKMCTTQAPALIGTSNQFTFCADVDDPDAFPYKKPGITVELIGAAAGHELDYVEAWKLSFSATPTEGTTKLRYIVMGTNYARVLLQMNKIPSYALTNDRETLDDEGTILDGICSNSIGEIVIPEGVKTVGAHAVRGCGIISVTFPTTLTSIEATGLYDYTPRGDYLYTFTGATAPTVVEGSFNITSSSAPTIRLAGEALSHAQNYIDAWKSVVYKARTGSDYTDANSAEAEGYVRALLGLDGASVLSLGDSMVGGMGAAGVEISSDITSDSLAPIDESAGIAGVLSDAGDDGMLLPVRDAAADGPDNPSSDSGPTNDQPEPVITDVIPAPANTSLPDDLLE